MNREQSLLCLTDRQRELIRLRDHEKLTWAKIGEALGVGGQYAAQLHKAAVKELARLEAEPDDQTPPQAHSAPVYSTPEEKVLRATDNSFMNEGGSFKAPEPALEIPQVSPQRKPLVAIATATSKPKVKWVTGVPMVLPKQGPVSVTIRA
jgi:hypothetical protein